MTSETTIPGYPMSHAQPAPLRQALYCSERLNPLVRDLPKSQEPLEPEFTLTRRQAIAESILGPVDWDTDDLGYLECPGIERHTSDDHERDCRLCVDDPPTLFCLHSSCRPIVANLNRRLRSEIGRAFPNRDAFRVARRGPSRPATSNTGRVDQPSKKSVLTPEQRQAAEREFEAVQNMEVISLEELSASSPIPIPADYAQQTKLHLAALFLPADVVWIGETLDSCQATASRDRREECSERFRTVDEWVRFPRFYGKLTTGSTFRPGSFSRSNDSVVDWKYLILESDTLSKTETLKLICHLSHQITLRAIVDTGGKSLHAWFELPPPEWLQYLKAVSEVWHLDPQMFKPSQPCRLPGRRREQERYQTLLWLNPAQPP